MRTRAKATILAMLTLLVLAPFIAVQPVAACTQGCTPGYWKNHPEAWVGHAQGDRVDGVFAAPSDLNGDGTADTLLDALNYKGGKGVEGATRILLRAAVASLLNSAADDGSWGWDWWAVHLVPRVNAAIASGSRHGMLALASELDFWNNVGCRL